jgi:hypothetical protein
MLNQAKLKRFFKISRKALNRKAKKIENLGMKTDFEFDTQLAIDLKVGFTTPKHIYKVFKEIKKLALIRFPHQTLGTRHLVFDVDAFERYVKVNFDR